jgi:hypothetical protein
MALARARELENLFIEPLHVDYFILIAAGVCWNQMFSAGGAPSATFRTPESGKGRLV